MQINKNKILKLKGSAVKVGHCVILNHASTPDLNNVAVITAITKKEVTAKYLERRRGSCASLDPDQVTPVEKFGIELSTNGVDVFVKKKNESVATRHDGTLRKWEDRYEGCSIYFANFNALAVARSAAEG